MMTRLAANVSLTLALCLPAAGGDASLAAGESRAKGAGDRVAVDRDRSDRAGGAKIQWITFPDERLQVCGLPWLEENGPHWWRLPKRAADKLPPAVARLMRFPTGARIRFSSDTSRLQIRLKASPTHSFGNMSPIGSRGLDAYVDGTYWSSATVTQEGEQELTFFQGAEGGPKEICIYLPSFQEVTVLAVGVDASAEPGPPAPFAERLPIVFYGSSIAQGACASRPGMSYEAILARRLNADYVNLGFSGSGKAEPEVVELVSRVEACCYVLDLGKSYRTQPAEVYAEMLRKIRADHADVPILCLTPSSPRASFTTAAMPSSPNTSAAWWPPLRAGGSNRATATCSLSTDSSCWGRPTPMRSRKASIRATSDSLGSPIDSSRRSERSCGFRGSTSGRPPWPLDAPVVESLRWLPVA